MSYKNAITNKSYFNIICQNCGEKGHHMKDCLNPKTSLGIVLYKRERDKNDFLLICRRNTIGFVEFIRGKYVYSDIEYIKDLFRVMTKMEVEIIKTKPFEYLWEYLWMDKKFNNPNDLKLKKNYTNALEKYNKIKNGYYVNNKLVKIDDFYESLDRFYDEQEWGFPKGRRSYCETDYEAALREFNEETQITHSDIRIISDTHRFEEIYKSYDNVTYKNIYYVAEYIGKSDIKIDDTNKMQYTEVSNIGFYALVDAMDKIRDYSIEKKNILAEINRYIDTLYE